MRGCPAHWILLAQALLLGVTAQAGTAQEGAPSHHRDGRFQNRYLEFEPKGLDELLRWRWQALRQGLPPAPEVATPQRQPALGFLHANQGVAQRPAVTWIGHATVLAQLGGLQVLTDPIFSERASPLSWIGPRRAYPPALAVQQLPRIDLVLISHNHYDHLDRASLLALNEQPGGPPWFAVPLGLKSLLQGWGIDKLIELDWWQRHTLLAPKGRVELVLTPVQHWSARGLGDRMRSLWGGFALLAPDCHLYFSGDTGYSPDFRDTAEHFAPEQRDGGGFDIALLPIGAYEPRWFMKGPHMNPGEAVRAARDLRAKQTLGIHWGTFELTDEPLDEPQRMLAAALAQQGVQAPDFFTLALGETRRIPSRAVAN